MKLLGIRAPKAAARTKATTGKRALALIGAVLLGSVLGIAPLLGVASASAATAFTQCNSIDNTPGLEVACTTSVTNRLDLGTGVTSSTIVARVCRGAAGTTPNGACTTTTSTSGQLVTSVGQCNAAANGGGGNIICSVSIINNVVGAPRLLGVTVNECIGSGTGGGANPLACSPVQSTTGATVTQCNGSVNGGGADGRVHCTVTGATSAITVLVNQCNGSVNGGGSTARCAVSFTNSVTAPAQPAPAPIPAPASTSPGGTGSGGGAAGTGGGTGSGPGTHELGGPGLPNSGGGGTAGAVAPRTAAGPFGDLGNRLAFTGSGIGGFLAASILALLAGGVLGTVSRVRTRMHTARA